MADNEFDIYQTPKGYVAVTNPVRRQILQALEGNELELPALVELTGKAKPTLSSVHMKDLLGQGLVESVPHPTDSRRKIYRLTASKIGSSSVPVDRLRDAVKEYVSLSPLAARFPLTFAFDALAAAPLDAPPGMLRQQARRLGALTAPVLQFKAVDDLVMGVAKFLEQERLARPLRLDLEHFAIDLEFGDGLPDVPSDRLGLLLAAFLEGVAEAKQLPTGPIRSESFEGERRCRIVLPEVPRETDAPPAPGT